MPKNIEGTVVQRFTNARIVGATVRIEPKEAMKGETKLCNSDKDGNFSINIDTLTPGQYVLMAFHPDAGPHMPRLEISIDQAKKVTIEEKEMVGPIKLKLEPLNIISSRAGLFFLSIILMVLLGLAALYWWLHYNYPAQPQTINKTIARLLKFAQDEASKEVPNYNLVKGSVNDAKKIFDAMRENDMLDLNFIRVTETLFVNVNTTIDEKKKDKILSAIRSLDKSTRDQQIPYFWPENPLKLLEMLFWAVAATLIRLAMNAGRYLRLRDFHANAIPHHVGYFFAVPIMAVLIAFVLSFVNVDFKLGESGVSLDFSNVIVSIVIASLVGLTPWRASEFLENLADAFFTKIGGIFPKEEENEITQPSVGEISDSPQIGEVEEKPKTPTTEPDQPLTSPPTEESMGSPPISSP